MIRGDINSDKDVYYGSNQYNGLPLETIMEPRHKFRQHIKVTLGPLTGLILNTKERRVIKMTNFKNKKHLHNYSKKYY